MFHFFTEYIFSVFRSPAMHWFAGPSPSVGCWLGPPVVALTRTRAEVSVRPRPLHRNRPKTIGSDWISRVKFMVLGMETLCDPSQFVCTSIHHKSNLSFQFCSFPNYCERLYLSLHCHFRHSLPFSHRLSCHQCVFKHGDDCGCRL